MSHITNAYVASRGAQTVAGPADRSTVAVCVYAVSYKSGTSMCVSVGRVLSSFVPVIVKSQGERKLLFMATVCRVYKTRQVVMEVKRV